MPIDKCFDLGFQVCHPLHGEQILKGGVLHRIRDIGKCVVSEELTCLAQVSSLGIQELFELTLLSLQLFLLNSEW